MAKKPTYEELEQRIKQLEPGDHLCCIYETEEEHRAVLTPFMRQGLDEGEKVIYIMDAHTSEQALKYMREDGLVVEPYLESGQLVVSTVDEAYMREGVFDPDSMISLLRDETERALDEGYSALRVIGEMTWALRGLPGSERLLEYEAKLNDFFPGCRCLAICQYDRRRFKPALLLGVLTTHPIAVIGMKVFDNFYYMHPKDFLGPDYETSMLNNWLESLDERKQKEEALRESEQRLRSLSCQLMKAQEKERLRLSKELHDELGQALALLKHRTRSIQRKLQEDQSSLHDECEETSRYIDTVIEKVRRLSKDLSPSILEDLSLTSALRWLIDNYAKQYSLGMSFDIEEIDHLFSKEAEINLYRISQEALTNIVKHAEANHVSFSVKKNENSVSFIIEDDGKGFDVKKVRARHSFEKGLGLDAMEERAHMLGAFLDVRSQMGKGARITLTIPIEKGGMS